MSEANTTKSIDLSGSGHRTEIVKSITYEHGNTTIALKDGISVTYNDVTPIHIAPGLREGDTVRYDYEAGVVYLYVTPIVSPEQLKGDNPVVRIDVNKHIEQIVDGKHTGNFINASVSLSLRNGDSFHLGVYNSMERAQAIADLLKGMSGLEVVGWVFSRQIPPVSEAVKTLSFPIRPPLQTSSESYTDPLPDKTLLS